MYDHLPGGEILNAGLSDLHAGVRTVDALLVLVAATRLAQCGIRVPRPAFGDSSTLPEQELFQMLSTEYGPAWYFYYSQALRQEAWEVLRSQGIAVPGPETTL